MGLKHTVGCSFWTMGLGLAAATLMGSAVDEAAAQQTITIGIMDEDRNGIGGRGNDRTLIPPNTALNADAYINPASPDEHRGGHSRTYVRGGNRASFIRYDMHQVLDGSTITEATFTTGGVVVDNHGSGQIDIYGLLPGLADFWVEADIDPANPAWTQTPPDPLTFNNAPAVISSGGNLVAVPGEVFGGVSLGSILFDDNDPVGTRYSLSGDADSLLVQFLNSALLDGEKLATFILLPASSTTPLADIRARDAGGAANAKSALTVTTVIPEPGAASLMAATGLMLALRRRRHMAI